MLPSKPDKISENLSEREFHTFAQGIPSDFCILSYVNTQNCKISRILIAYTPEYKDLVKIVFDNRMEIKTNEKGRIGRVILCLDTFMSDFETRLCQVFAVKLFLHP